jgi:hypothetical protein
MNSGSVDLLSPDDSFLVRSSVVRLRLRAQAELDPLHILDFSDGFLIKFLRARDMDVELSLKVRPPSPVREREATRGAFHLVVFT